MTYQVKCLRNVKVLKFLLKLFLYKVYKSKNHTQSFVRNTNVDIQIQLYIVFVLMYILVFMIPIDRLIVFPREKHLFYVI